MIPFSKTFIRKEFRSELTITINLKTSWRNTAPQKIQQTSKSTSFTKSQLNLSYALDLSIFQAMKPCFPLAFLKVKRTSWAIAMLSIIFLLDMKLTWLIRTTNFFIKLLNLLTKFGNHLISCITETNRSYLSYCLRIKNLRHKSYQRIIQTLLYSLIHQIIHIFPTNIPKKIGWISIRARGY